MGQLVPAAQPGADLDVVHLQRQIRQSFPRCQQSFDEEEEKAIEAAAETRQQGGAIHCSARCRVSRNACLPFFFIIVIIERQYL